MLFEEFFKKKKISLDALKQGNPDLFSEFKLHYEQMGEKSFDHTKKFWFNKLRHQFPLPPEVKVEKLRAENQIAEQTVADTLTEPSPGTPAPKLGFTPKFKTQGTPLVTDAPKPETTPGDEPPKEAAAKPAAYKPRFQAKNVPAKSADNTGNNQTGASPDVPVNEQAEAPTKMGFKPRFKASVTTNKPVETKEEQPEINKEAESTGNTENSTGADEVSPAKLGFKPRFKAGTTTVKPADDSVVPTTERDFAEQSDPIVEADAPKPIDAPKLGFKPRFKAGVTTATPAESAKTSEPVAAKPETATDNQPENPTESAPVTPPKLGFKPRFKAGVITTKPAETESIEPVAEPEVAAKEEQVPGIEPVEKENPETPVSDTPVKPAYKPRFNPNMVKRNPPQEE